MEVIMRDNYGKEGKPGGEFKSGLYATYCGEEHPATYLGVGRFILYSDIADENFVFPSQDGRYLLQTDLRDDNLTRAYEVRMIGVIRESYESVTIRNIFRTGVIISTYNPRLGFSLGLKPTKEHGFTGLVDRKILIGMYDERDYLFNSNMGICTTLGQATGRKKADLWFAEKDRLSKLFILEHKKVPK
jgi:hypothetical protein